LTPIEETTAVLARVGDALLVASRQENGREGADLRRAVGELVDRAPYYLARGVVGQPLTAAFRAVTLAGCQIEGIERVRLSAQIEPAVSPLAGAVGRASSRMALVEMARIVGGISFRSREEVQSVTARVNAAFAPIEDEAADLGEHVVYRDLVALHASVTRDLVQRGRPLPRLVPYRGPRRQPALVLANGLYGAADRADEIVGENRAVHPLFMPASGMALSV
jgi:hypothetical protein